MPTYLDGVVERAASDLDEKASTALRQLDGVNALSILQKLSERGDEVRNRSAFVATAAKSARDKGGAAGAGPEQLKCALDRLKLEGIIDENAVDVLTKGIVHVGEACHAVTVFVSQEEGSVRNASAYITRSVTNARKNPSAHQGPPMQQPGAYLPQAVPIRSPSPYAGYGSSDLFARYRSVLDEKALAALDSVPPDQASDILQALDARGGSIKNPSAWVVKSVGNAGGSVVGLPPVFAAPPAYAAAVYYPPSGCGKGGGKGGYGPAPAGKGRSLPRHPLLSSLDEVAQSALEEVGMEAATAILQALEAQGGKVNNPSAYVIKSVGNARKGQGAGGLAASSSHGGFAPPPGDINRRFVQGDFIGQWRSSLDPDAINALESVGPDAGSAILSELEAKSSTVRNPSAYVVKSVGNAKHGRQPAGQPAGLPPSVSNRGGNIQAELAELPVALDEKASLALQELAPSDAHDIIQHLTQQGSSIGNPSAYVMKSVGNKKKGIR